MTDRRYIECQRFGGPEELVLTSAPITEPGRGDLLVAVDAIGVNFADTMVRRGEYRKDQALPQTPGMEVAGTVVRGGPDTTIAPGTRVAVFCEHGGGYASHVLAHEGLVFPVDADIDPTLVAASFLQGVTAWYALHRYGRVTAGDSVLVTGAAGGLGSWLVQLAVDAGTRVIGTASTAAKRRYLADFGCDEVLDPNDPSLSTHLRSTAPEGFTAIIDGVGGELFRAILPALARGGRFVVVGSATQQPAVVDVRRLMPRGQTITGFVVRNVIDEDPREPQNALNEILARVVDDRVKVDVTTLPLSEAPEAHRLVEGRDVIGKLVLDPHR